MTTLEVKEKFPVGPWNAHWGGGGQKGAKMYLQASVVRSILTKSCACILGRVLGPVRCEKRNKITGQR